MEMCPVDNDVFELPCSIQIVLYYIYKSSSLVRHVYPSGLYRNTHHLEKKMLLGRTLLIITD